MNGTWSDDLPICFGMYDISNILKDLLSFLFRSTLFSLCIFLYSCSLILTKNTYGATHDLSFPNLKFVLVWKEKT